MRPAFAVIVLGGDEDVTDALRDGGLWAAGPPRNRAGVPFAAAVFTVVNADHPDDAVDRVTAELPSDGDYEVVYVNRLDAIP